MARTYRRDSNGRFSSGSGSSARGGKKSKPAASVAARKQQLVKNVSSAALKGQKTTATARSYVRAQQQAKQTTGGKGSKAAKRVAAVQAKAAQASRSKAFSSKAAPNKAKAAYKAARSKAREAVMLAGGRTSTRGVTNTGLRQTVKAAQSAAARVRAMEKNRGRKRTSRKK